MDIPSTPPLPLDRTGLLVLHVENDRHVLVVLADTPETLQGLVDRLAPDGDFRSGLAHELVGVYRP
jgi:hypothetical protein